MVGQDDGANGNGHKPLARDPETGYFLKGNSGGPGGGWARRVSLLRRTLHEAVTVEDMRAVIGTMIQQARKGDPIARRELFDRLDGRPSQQHVIMATSAQAALLSPEQIAEMIFAGRVEPPALPG